MKYTFEMDSIVMLYVPSFMYSVCFRYLKADTGDTRTHRMETAQAYFWKVD
jgi:hypothetical protein